MSVPYEIPPGIPNLIGTTPIGPGVTTVTPNPGVLPAANLANLDNWRALLHQVTPVVVSALMALHIAGGDPNRIGIYVAIFFAVVDPLLSFTNSTDTARRIVYGLTGTLQSAGAISILFAGVVGPIVPLATAAVTIVSSFLGRFYCPTSTLR